MPVQRIVGGVEIERDLCGCTTVGREETIDEQRVDRVYVGRDLCIARGLRAAQLQAVQSALARKRCAVGAPCRELARQHRMTGSWRSWSWPTRSS